MLATLVLEPQYVFWLDVAVDAVAVNLLVVVVGSGTMDLAQG
jgi:hypothetical protein